MSLPAERVRLAARADGRPDVHWDRPLFSTKESVHKAWLPLTGMWLGFEEAAIELHRVPRKPMQRRRDASEPNSSSPDRWRGDTGSDNSKDGGPSAMAWSPTR
ncbi:hypothetical protein OG604_25685 [Streptomyces sp. NBC_01231]|nr:hypothetical protein OG604_25685 [Streptomyces sp. NBC_01231]